MNDVILSVQDLHKTFTVNGNLIKAVDGVSFDVSRGECFAIVGESGSGKSLSLIHISEPTRPY